MMYLYKCHLAARLCSELVNHISALLLIGDELFVEVKRLFTRNGPLTTGQFCPFCPSFRKTIYDDSIHLRPSLPVFVFHYFSR